MSQKHAVAVVGAGPAGIYAADLLAESGVEVALINRDIKPGGLAEYGIYHNKYKMKSGLRKQFKRILKNPNISYFGNVTIGNKGHLSLDDIRGMGFSAVLVTVGAQGTKWLGLPGEELTGVYHAKDLVYHYNRLPPFSEQEFHIGKRVAIIGVGNVMIDIAHWLVRDLHVDEVIAIARRGPAEVKFTQVEFRAIGENLDMDAFNQEMDRVAPVMESVNQDIDGAREFILKPLNRGRAYEKISDTRFRFRFLASPKQIVSDENGKVSGLEVDETTLTLRENGGTKVSYTGETTQLDVDTVVFAIGDKVDDTFGLPIEWNEFIKNPNPRFPVDDHSYETYDPESKMPIKGVFVAGWSREASSGLVGEARKDGRNGASAVLSYLNDVETSPLKPVDTLRNQLLKSEGSFIDKGAWQKIEAAEEKIATDESLEEFKFSSNEKMLEIVGRSSTP